MTVLWHFKDIKNLLGALGIITLIAIAIDLIYANFIYSEDALIAGCTGYDIHSDLMLLYGTMILLYGGLIIICLVIYHIFLGKVEK